MMQEDNWYSSFDAKLGRSNELNVQCDGQAQGRNTLTSKSPVSTLTRQTPEYLSYRKTRSKEATATSTHMNQLIQKTL